MVAHGSGNFKNLKTKRRIVLVQMGARNHYVEAIAFHELGMLDRLFTDFYNHQDLILGKLLRRWMELPKRFQPGLLKKMVGRSSSMLPSERIVDFPPLSAIYVLVSQLKKVFPIAEIINTRFASLLSFYVSKRCSPSIFGVFAFNTGALEVFQWAKENGVKCILEQVNYPKLLQKRLYEQERCLWPDWEARRNTFASWSGSAQRESREWKLADAILAPSKFVAEGLAQCGVDPKKVHFVPYGVDTSVYSARTGAGKGQHRKLRVIFVGGVILGKGVQYLHEALELLPHRDFHVRIVGPNLLSATATERLRQRCELVGSVPRADMPEVYRWADVMVFPSISEGSALVVYEALASGIPVITTPNAGSIVRDGRDGYIVHIRDPQMIANRLERLAVDPQLRRQMGQNAVRWVKKEGSLQRYRGRLAEVIRSIE